jgi:hypothetical protein
MADDVPAAMTALAAAIRRADAADAVGADATAFLASYGVADADAAALLAKGGQRFLIYRRLVHNRLRAAAKDFIPRAAARRGNEAFIADFAAFMEASASKSPYLRDVPGEFVTWVLPRWAADPDLPPFLGDLARHELLEGEVRNDPGGGEPSTGKAIDLDAPLRFDGSCRLMHYDWAVHKLPYATDDRTEPEHRSTHLLVYRDPEARVRYLELTPWASAVLSALLDERDTVKAGLVAAAARLGEPLDDDKLAKAAMLFADLAERSVLLGAE